MIPNPYLRRHMHDLSGRLALYGAVIGCVVVAVFLLGLLAAALRQSPYPVELIVAALGLVTAAVGVIAAGVGYSLMKRSLLTTHAARSHASFKGDPGIELVEADVLDIVENSEPPRSLPRGAQTLLVLSMRREDAQDVIASLEELYPLQTKYHGKMRASTLAWMNVLQIISFKPVARLSSLVAGIFVSPRL